ncbi:NAD-dependent malic enzyme [Dermatobacter hominis]|uniref:NAD-dependent malic enzyme n=1 Tax=Dermatobacter hominis TaxID=2884263 RepID=UPI001D126317|nr:NAD-dependent malic enzyme [Dermatobacter hominis]UDY34084.1 NAD-dependent malic enzyme [Dermatobacter hominis]
MADTPTPAYSVRIRVRMENKPGMLGRLAIAIGEVGANISALQGFEVKTASLDEDVVVNCTSEAHQEQVRAAVEAIDGIEVLEFEDRTFHMHEGGKIEVLPLAPVRDVEDLSMAYTPGVARVCMEIAKNPASAHRYTIKKNTVAIVSDGTAVLGLGDIGPAAAMPVMEGKALLFKHFAGVDAFPICLDTKDPDEIIETVLRLEPTFGGINLEDIAAPGAFEVEERLDEIMDIPVFHDDQHGTAIVTLAALENALKIVGKDIGSLKVVVAGVGAAGVAVSKILMNAGVRNIIGADRQGAVHTGRDDLNTSKQWFAENTNPDGLSGPLAQLLPGADVFIGLSGPNLIERSDVEGMAEDPIVFAMANPDPEIRPELIQDVAAVIATGRSDFPNQINNVLAFPGVFRGALDAGARRITENMKVASARAIASTVLPDELAPDFIIPSVFNPAVSVAVAEACAEAARADGVCR